VLIEWIQNSTVMRDLLRLSEKVIHSKGPILIQGEAGTGKTLLAQYIHQRSSLPEGTFVRIDCASIPETLFESELFGYIKGAFSDAIDNKMGLVEAAQGGSLFFHHIEELPKMLQPKILRFFETLEYRPVGSPELKKLNARLMVSINTNLTQNSKVTVLNDELFYRVSVFNLRLPPLNQRVEDIPDLIKLFKRHYSNLNEIPESRLLEALIFSWPGNVRQLKNWIERSAAFGEWLSPSNNEVENKPLSLQEAVRNFKSTYVLSVLNMVGGNQTQAAKILKINRTHLIKLLKFINQGKEKT
jgi:DNA-binding NtrC family response regulator